ncbi:hypothetical protein PTKIN_Ptkin01aG0295200 [Pterospermum kingtungense]
MGFCASIRSLWLIRNDIVFKGDKPDFVRLINLVSLRVAFKSKAKWSELKEDESVIGKPGPFWIKEAFRLFLVYKWATTYRLTTESDSYNVAKWVSDPDKAP